ncbi:MAG TPA: methylmalonyl-CoA mutase family protein, partial [Promineifilum sp.]|nr:methylmalonyl-CoA mutase family protein [Promineifilum sp.]
MDEPTRDDALTFDEFPIPTADEWRAAAVDSLGGQPFEKLISRTYEDIPLQPLYRREDTAELAYAQTLPGQPPYLRGRTAAGPTQHGWAIAQELTEHDPAIFNAALITALEHGQTAVTIRLDDGAGAGLRLATVADVATALRGVYLQGLPVILHAGPTALPLLALLAAARPAGAAEGGLAELTGSIAADPLAALAETGALPLPLASAYDDMALVAEWAAAAAPGLATVAVRAGLYHEAGGSAVHELAL